MSCVLLEDKLYSRLEMKYRAERVEMWITIENKLYSRLAMKYRAEKVELWITRR